MDPLHILQSACINCPFTETLKQFHFCKFWLFLLLLYLWPPRSTNIFPTKTSSKKVIGPQDSDFISLRQILIILVSRNKAFTLPYRMNYYPLLATYQLINYHPQWVGWWLCWGGAHRACKNTTWISYTLPTSISGPCKFTFSAGNINDLSFCLQQCLPSWQVLSSGVRSWATLHNSESQHVTESYTVQAASKTQAETSWSIKMWLTLQAQS